MTNDCLVTKLKGTVNNDNLEQLGYFTVNAISGGTPSSEENQKIYTIFNEDTNSNNNPGLVALDGGYFVDSFASQTSIGNKEGALKNVRFITNIPVEGTFRVRIKKYSLTYFTARSIIEVNVDDLKYSPIENLSLLDNNLAYGDISNLTNMGTLKTFIVDTNCYNLHGKLSDFGKCVNLERLSWCNFSNLTGNLTDLLPCTHLHTLDLYNDSGVNGSATIFTNSETFTNLQNLNLTNTANITDKTAEVKAQIEAAHPNITIMW